MTDPPLPDASAITAWTDRPAFDRRNHTLRDGLLIRVRAEFEEMPGLRLTLPQVCRLFGLREDVCGRIVASLERDGVVCQGPDGRFGSRLSS